MLFPVSGEVMAGGNFMNRVLSYLVNELLVEKLSNSPSFQRFAVRTSRTLEDLSTKGIQMRFEVSERLKDLSRKIEKDR